MSEQIQISEPARDAAQALLGHLNSLYPVKIECSLLDYYFQKAIAAATEKLTKELAENRKSTQIAAAEIVSLTKELAEVKAELGPLQTCAACGEVKHTPARLDALGGYVCLTCILNDRQTLRQTFDQNFAQYNVALASLTKERDELKKRIATDFMSGVVIEKESEISSLTKQLLAMRELIAKAAKVKLGYKGTLAVGEIGIEPTDWDKALAATPPELEKRFCRREVLEKLTLRMEDSCKEIKQLQSGNADAVDQLFQKFLNRNYEALTLARAELKEGKE